MQSAQLTQLGDDTHISRLAALSGSSEDWHVSGFTFYTIIHLFGWRTAGIASLERTVRCVQSETVCSGNTINMEYSRPSREKERVHAEPEGLLSIINRN